MKRVRRMLLVMIIAPIIVLVWHYSKQFLEVDTCLDAGKIYDFQLVQNYDEIAFKTLKDRTLREIGNTALRIGAKKISQYSLQEKNEGLGVVLGLVNAFTESADTRNWQTLPSKIYYSRIPLKRGENVMQLKLQSSSGNENKIEIKVSGKKGLQFRKVSTLKVYQ